MAQSLTQGEFGNSQEHRRPHGPKVETEEIFLEDEDSQWLPACCGSQGEAQSRLSSMALSRDLLTPQFRFLASSQVNLCCVGHPASSQSPRKRIRTSLRLRAGDFLAEWSSLVSADTDAYTHIDIRSYIHEDVASHIPIVGREVLSWMLLTKSHFLGIVPHMVKCKSKGQYWVRKLIWTPI